MGAKSAVLVSTDGVVAELLQAVIPPADRDRAAALLAHYQPGLHLMEDGEDPRELADALYPPKGTVCALSVPGLDIICDQEIMIDRPSQLPEHLVKASRGRRLYLHTMHSVVDWLAFAVWEDGRLIRSLSLSPDGGIAVDVGNRLPFELPYWQGRHPVEPGPPNKDEEPYALPFHPLDLGERAMLEFFGFYVERCSDEDDLPEPVVDTWGVELRGYRRPAAP
jgi:hypothetical protein